MTKAVRSVFIKRPQDAAFTDFSAWVDAANYRAPSASLSGVPATAAVRIVNVANLVPPQPLPFVPEDGCEVRLDDVTAATVFGGWVSGPVTVVPGPRVPAYDLYCQPWTARLTEVATGSLNKSGVLDTDRNFVITAIRDALTAAALAVGTDPMLDDPIITANEAVSWSGVQGTAFYYGGDWSYQQLLGVLTDMIARVPGVSLRVRPDKIVEYGVFATPGPVALCSAPDAALMLAAKAIEIDADTYEEETLSAGHYNKVRLGGIGAAEATAYDTVSIGRYGRVMTRPYENDEAIAAADVTRAAYARLAASATRRIVRVRTTNDVDELVPGMVVPVLVTDIGCFGDEGWTPETGGWYIGTPLLEPATGYRGELLVQKVTPTRRGPDVQEYEIELGAYVRDFDHSLAARIGGDAVG